MRETMHTIKFVAQHTGLSAHTIRAWERRYAALSPERTATNRRLYSTDDMEKLSLLRRAVQAGHNIGQIARLSLSDLQRLLAQNEALEAEKAPAKFLPLEECLRAVEQLDAAALEYALTRAAAMLGTLVMIDQVALPLLQRIGERWREGEVRVAHEHMASAIVRTYL